MSIYCPPTYLFGFTILSTAKRLNPHYTPLVQSEFELATLACPISTSWISQVTDMGLAEAVALARVLLSRQIDAWPRTYYVSPGKGNTRLKQSIANKRHFLAGYCLKMKCYPVHAGTSGNNSRRRPLLRPRTRHVSPDEIRCRLCLLHATPMLPTLSRATG